MQEDPKLALQVRVSKMLSTGFVLSLVGVGGVGSLVALVIGLRARKIIRESGDEISGMKMAWWCIVAGTVGTLVLPYLSWVVIKAANK
jgi:hypothetical protein